MRIRADNTFRLAASLTIGLLAACSQAPNYAPVKTVNQTLKPHQAQSRQTNTEAYGHERKDDQRLPSSSQSTPKATPPVMTVTIHSPDTTSHKTPGVPANRKNSSPKLTSKSPPTIIDKRPETKSIIQKDKSVQKSKTENKTSPIAEKMPFKPQKTESGKLKKDEKFSNQAIIASQNLSAADHEAVEKVLTNSKNQSVEKSVISINNKKVLKLNFEWPMHGKMTRNFAQTDHKGIDITGNIGDSVKAAESGTAVYCGQGLKGFGKLIVIKHNETFLSAYANNSKLYISEGQRIKKGQTIGQVGLSGFKKTSLHFEIRKNGKPVNPLSLLTNH